MSFKVLIISALVTTALGLSVFYFVNQGKEEFITQTLKVVPVYGALQGPGGGEPCAYTQDCSAWQQGEVCYPLEPVSCNNDAQCNDCGAWHECRYYGAEYGDICFGGLSEEEALPCGVCAYPPGEGDDPATCEELMPVPSFRFSILNPIGVEKAYITSEGYLDILGNGYAELDLAGFDPVETLRPNYDCGSAPAGALEIEDDNGDAVAAFVACQADSDIIFYADGQILEFETDDYQGGNNFVIKNEALDDMTAAWIDGSGDVHLKACYAGN